MQVSPRGGWLGLSLLLGFAGLSEPAEAKSTFCSGAGCCATCHLNPTSAVCPLKDMAACFKDSFLWKEDKDGDGFFNGEELLMGTNFNAKGDVDECTDKLRGESFITCAQVCTDGPERDDAHCSCLPGFDIENEFGCKDKKECAQAGICALHSTCKELEGSYQCPCDEGYFGDGRLANGCLDVDHCAGAKPGCSPLSRCVSTQAGYECWSDVNAKLHCPAGYAGKGEGPTGCKDVPECTDGTAKCDPLSACIEQEGGYACGPCPAGYSGDGVDGCVAIDACAGVTCSTFAVCVSEGGRGCQCLPGYSGDGVECADVDECAAGDACPGELCENLPGTFRCRTLTSAGGAGGAAEGGSSSSSPAHGGVPTSSGGAPSEPEPNGSGAPSANDAGEGGGGAGPAAPPQGKESGSCSTGPIGGAANWSALAAAVLLLGRARRAWRKK